MVLAFWYMNVMNGSRLDKSTFDCALTKKRNFKSNGQRFWMVWYAPARAYRVTKSVVKHLYLIWLFVFQRLTD